MIAVRPVVAKDFRYGALRLWIVKQLFWACHVRSLGALEKTRAFGMTSVKRTPALYCLAHEW
jgi:hypothetical protein